MKHTDNETQHMLRSRHHDFTDDLIVDVNNEWMFFSRKTTIGDESFIVYTYWLCGLKYNNYMIISDTHPSNSQNPY